MEAYFPDEIVVREPLTEKIKRIIKITNITDTGLITSTVITGEVSTAMFASGVTYLLVLINRLTKKFVKIFNVK